jgi:hypothetical protein
MKQVIILVLITLLSFGRVHAQSKADNADNIDYQLYKTDKLMKLVKNKRLRNRLRNQLRSLNLAILANKSMNEGIIIYD